MIGSLSFLDTTPHLKIPGDIRAASSGSNTNISPSDEDAIRKVAAEFEAIFVNYMLKAMRNTVNKESLFDRKTEAFDTSFLDQELSKVVASRGIGLAEMLVKEFKVSTPSIRRASRSSDSRSTTGASTSTGAGSSPSRLLLGVLVVLPNGRGVCVE